MSYAPYNHGRTRRLSSVMLAAFALCGCHAVAEFQPSRADGPHDLGGVGDGPSTADGRDRLDGGPGDARDTRDAPAPDAPAGDGPARDAAPDATQLTPPYVVSADGWGRRLPLFTSSLRALWGTTRDNVWLAGNAGALAHHGPGGWRAVDSGVTSDINSIWGRSATDVWFAGDAGTILHFDGATLRPVVSGTSFNLEMVRGAAGHTWVVGQEGTILRDTGSGFTPVPDYPYTTTIHAVWLYSPDDVLVTGWRRLTRWQAGQWIEMPVTGTTATIHALWAPALDDIWVGDGDGQILHYDGQWTAVYAHQPPAGSPVPDVSIRAIWGQPGGTTWAAAEQAVLRDEGGGWDVVVEATDRTFYGFWSWPGGDLMIPRNSGLLLRHDADGVLHEIDMNPGTWFYDIALHGTEVWLVGSTGGESGAYRDRGQGFERLPWDIGPPSTLNAIWIGGADDVWAVGNQATVVRFDPATQHLVRQTVPDLDPLLDLEALWGVPGGSLWVCGSDGVIHRRDPSGDWFKELSPTTETLRGLWGASAQEIWAVGSAGTVLRRTGSSWVEIVNASIPTARLRAIAGRAADDFWIVGDGGTTVHFFQGAWNELAAAPLPLATDALRDLVIDGAGTPWAVSDAGQLFKREAGGWTTVLDGMPSGLYGLALRDPSDIWVAGADGLLMHFDDR